jgi:O-phosphoseryl-tRNA(Cys) synthetase
MPDWEGSGWVISAQNAGPAAVVFNRAHQTSRWFVSLANITVESKTFPSSLQSVCTSRPFFI